VFAAVCGSRRSPCSPLSDVAVGGGRGIKDQTLPAERQTVPHNEKW